MIKIASSALLSPIFVALLAAYAVPACAADASEVAKESGESFQWFKYGGFGTFAGTNVNNSGSSQFKSNNRMPTGTDSTESWEWDNDSAFGVQATITPFKNAQEWSVVTQLLSRRNKDNSYYPTTDWLYLAYKANQNLTVRAGRFIAPVYMVSDYRNVNYANPWLRPPVEVYSMGTINNVDGIDAIIKGSFGDLSYTLQPFYGHFDLKQPGATMFRFSEMAGLNTVTEYGALSVRLGYMKARHSVIRKPPYNSKADYSATEDTNAYRGNQNCNTSAGYGSTACPYPNAVNQVYPEYNQVASYYDRDDRPFDIAGVGFVYDDRLFMQGEFVYKRAASASPNAIGWYLTSGWRFGDLLPYVTYSQHREIARFDTLHAGADFPKAKDQVIGSSSDNKQRTLSIGARYDFARNFAFKVQYDQVTPQRGSLNGSGSGKGLGWTGSPSNFYQAKHVEVIAASIDFVF